MTGAPLLSVVVMGYRNRDTILRAVASIVEQQRTERFEVVVVTSGDDGSAELVRDHFPQLTVIDVPGRLLPGGARNLGVAASSGAAVAFLAADCLAEPGWAIGRIRAHGRGHAAVASAVTTAPPQGPAAWALHFDMYCHRLLGRPAGRLATHDPAAYGVSFDRELLTRIGPFDDTVGIHEDKDAAARVSGAGVGVWYEPSIVTAYCGPRRFADLMTEASRRSAQAARVSPLPAGALNRRAVLCSFGPMWWRGVRRRAATAWRYGSRQERGRLLVSLPWLMVARAAALVGWYSVRMRRPSNPAPRHVAHSPIMAAAEAALHTPPGIAPESAPHPVATVVVPAFNEERAIADCLDSLFAQSLEALEIIVVDDGSTDRTAAIARSRGIDVLTVPHRGPAAAKNAGAAQATGDVLVFIDADHILERSCIERLCAPILAGVSIGTFTRDIKVANPDNAWADCWTLNRGAARGEHFARPLPDQWENFRAVRRRAFLDVGGYDDVGYGEDMTLAPKLGALAQVVPGAEMLHRHPDTLREVWQNARWLGRGPAVRTAHTSRRFLPPASLKRGLRGARRLRRPRFLLFAFVYDWGVLSAYWETRLGRRFHAK